MKIAAALALQLCLLTGLQSAAIAQTERDVIEVVRAQIQTNRQALVAENMQLSGEEADGFWPVYRDYQNDRSTLMDRRVELLTRFRDHFDSLSEEQARDMVDDYVKLEDDYLKLRRKYLPKFRKVLSEKKTMRYLQIENKLDDIINFELSQIVPLAE